MKDSFDHCCQHLRSAGYLGATEFTNHLRRLEQYCGLEEAISICSQIGNYFKRLLVDVEVDRPNCIRMKRYLLPSGRRSKRPALKLIREAYSQLDRIKLNDPINFDSPEVKKILALVNLKHCFKLKSPTKKHIDKFNSSISYKTENDILGKYSKTISLGASRFGSQDFGRNARLNYGLLSGPSISSYELRRTKSPVLNTDGSITSAPGYEPITRQLAPLFHWLATTEDLRVKSPLYLCLDRLIGYKYVNDDGVFSYKHVFNSLEISGGIPIRGKISHIMESGGKDRVVAQPFLVFQALFEPLKQFLNSTQLKHPRIYTHMQSAGVSMGQLALQKKKTLFCFDASGFTDRFPLQFQVLYLKCLGLDNWASLIQSFVEDGVWYDSQQQSFVKYAQGQPMGLGPSFALATLTHAALLDGLWKERHDHRNPPLESYAIVGDDIIITDEQLARDYQELMKFSGVEINLSKSIISDRYGEFCGILFNDWTRTVPFKPKSFKWSFPALVKALSFYGRSYYRNLDPRSKHVLLAKETPSYKGGDLHRTSILTYVKDVRDAVVEALENLSLSTRNHIPDYEHLYKMTEEVMEINRSQGLITPGPKLESNPTFYDIFRNRNSGPCYAENLSRFQLVNQLKTLLEDIDCIQSLLDVLTDRFEDVDFLLEEARRVAREFKSLPIIVCSVEQLKEVKPKLADPVELAEQHKNDFNEVPILIELGESIDDVKPLPSKDLSDLSL